MIAFAPTARHPSGLVFNETRISQVEGKAGKCRKSVSSSLGSQVAEGHVRSGRGFVVLHQIPGTCRQELMVLH